MCFAVQELPPQPPLSPVPLPFHQKTIHPALQAALIRREGVETEALEEGAEQGAFFGLWRLLLLLLAPEWEGDDVCARLGEGEASEGLGSWAEEGSQGG